MTYLLIFSQEIINNVLEFQFAFKQFAFLAFLDGKQDFWHLLIFFRIHVFKKVFQEYQQSVEEFNGSTDHLV